MIHTGNMQADIISWFVTLFSSGFQNNEQQWWYTTSCGFCFVVCKCTYEICCVMCRFTLYVIILLKESWWPQTWMNHYCACKYFLLAWKNVEKCILWLRISVWNPVQSEVVCCHPLQVLKTPWQKWGQRPLGWLTAIDNHWWPQNEPQLHVNILC